MCVKQKARTHHFDSVTVFPVRYQFGTSFHDLRLLSANLFVGRNVESEKCRIEREEKLATDLIVGKHHCLPVLLCLSPAAAAGESRKCCDWLAYNCIGTSLTGRVSFGGNFAADGVRFGQSGIPLMHFTHVASDLISSCVWCQRSDSASDAQSAEERARRSSAHSSQIPIACSHILAFQLPFLISARSRTVRSICG